MWRSAMLLLRGHTLVRSTDNDDEDNDNDNDDDATMRENLALTSWPWKALFWGLVVLLHLASATNEDPPECVPPAKYHSVNQEASILQCSQFIVSWGLTDNSTQTSGYNIENIETQPCYSACMLVVEQHSTDTINVTSGCVDEYAICHLYKARMYPDYYKDSDYEIASQPDAENNCTLIKDKKYDKYSVFCVCDTKGCQTVNTVVDVLNKYEDRVLPEFVERRSQRRVRDLKGSPPTTTSTKKQTPIVTDPPKKRHSTKHAPVERSTTTKVVKPEDPATTEFSMPECLPHPWYTAEDFQASKIVCSRYAVIWGVTDDTTGDQDYIVKKIEEQPCNSTCMIVVQQFSTAIITVNNGCVDDSSLCYSYKQYMYPDFYKNSDYEIERRDAQNNCTLIKENTGNESTVFCVCDHTGCLENQDVLDILHKYEDIVLKDVVASRTKKKVVGIMLRQNKTPDESVDNNEASTVSATVSPSKGSILASLILLIVIADILETTFLNQPK